MQGMRAVGFLFGTQIRHSKGRDERPMPETHERVPYEGASRPALQAIRIPALSFITLIWVKAAICQVVQPSLC
jgi:hypothetical protein